MMDAAGKPDTLQINFESLEIFAFAITLVMKVYSLQGFTDAQVVFTLLVEGDITSQEGCLRQAININFLCERQVFETLQLITEHLDIGKSLLSVYITFCHFYLYLPCKSNTFFSTYQTFPPVFRSLQSFLLEICTFSWRKLLFMQIIHYLCMKIKTKTCR